MPHAATQQDRRPHALAAPDEQRRQDAHRQQRPREHGGQRQRDRAGRLQRDAP